MKKLVFISALFTLLFYSLKAQKEANIWYFGEYAGIDFNQNPPQALLNSSMFQYEGCATISDNSGSLLFYTNGITVWNKNHQVMLNGTNLMGHPSSTQSSVIVPKPGNDKIYYVFTVYAEISDTIGIRYSKIDMELDNGNGAVTDEKNIFLIGPSEEKITAVRHANGKDVWVITHTWNSNHFESFLVTEEGVNKIPVISAVGTFHSGQDVHGNLKVSPDGKKLAIITRMTKSFELFDFNAQTGEVSNPVAFPPFQGQGALYGIEFSPDCSKLYVGRYLDGSDIFQYDLQAGTPDQIIASKTLIGTVSNYHLGALQLAPDYKIYVSKHDNLFGDDYLGVINSPNNKGVDCDFVEDGFYLEGKKCIWGLPNFIQSYFNNQLEFTWHPDCYGDTTRFFLSFTGIIDSVFWNFDDTASGNQNVSTLVNPYHVFTSTGTFTVKVIVYSDSTYYEEEREVVIKPLPFVDLGSDTSICSTTPYTLCVSGDYSTYLWQDGSQDSVYMVDTSGTYWVTVENECGTASDTVNVTFTQSFDIDLGQDTALCYGNTITLSPVGNFAGYQWQDGSGDSVFTVYQTGLYWVTVFDSVGCSATDSILIQIFQSFNFSLGNDTAICYGDYLFLNGPQGYSSYLWQDGSQYSSIIADTAGIYWLEVTDTNNCKARDSLVLTVDKIPGNFIVSDTLMCKDSTLILRTHPLFEQYFWQDGSQDSVLTIADTGKYWVTVFDSIGCSGTDTVDIGYYPELALQLQTDGYLCDDDSVVLTAVSNYDNYLWQDSSQNSIYIAKDSGIYWVKVSSTCETKSDTIVIDACSSIWVPNVFTPNNDGYNDYFYAVGKNIPKFKMVIFNRWGQTLKVLNNINEKWDGTYKGHSVSEGTYFWVADFEQVERGGAVVHKRLQGSVTLVK